MEESMKAVIVKAADRLVQDWAKSASVKICSANFEMQ
jgi:hypothetical protein